MENELYIRTSPVLTIEKTEFILKQMKYTVCKIGNSNGTGFFCQIPLINNSSIKGLITAFHVFNTNCSNTIEISLNNGKRKYKLDLKTPRLIYKDEKDDVVIIEIKPQDNIECLYLEIQENTCNKKDFSNFNDLYNNKLIYILQYPYGYESKVSFGISKVILRDKNKYYIRHNCSTEKELQVLLLYY